MRSKAIAVAIGLLTVVALVVSPVAAKKKGGKIPPPPKDATQIAIEHLGVDPSTVKVTDRYTSAHNGVTHVYLRQLSDGVEIAGADATVNVQKGVVIFSGSRFIDPENVSGQQVLTAKDAVEIARAAVGSDDAKVAGRADLLYRVLKHGTARLAYDVQVKTAKHWWSISVDAANGRILQRFDFVDSESAVDVAARTARTEDAAIADAAVEPIFPSATVDDGSTYNVYGMPLESPNDGDRVIMANPADAAASPFGWHDTNGLVGPEFTITRGNNVNAYADTIDDNAPDPGSQPNGGPGLDFSHSIPTFDATPLIYRDAAVDNLFYWNNVMHDVTFGYGFNEEAGNFQASNYSGKGRGGDDVLAQAQDGSGALNANFSTPPDGQPGRMQMYLWVDAFDTLGLGPEDVVRPYSHQMRDGDLDSGVIAHEYGHGVSNRLVGGPNNVSCLRTHDEREGEGWSDWWSYVLTMRPGDDGATPRGIGTYVVYHEEGRTGNGIRITPYSTDMEINPSTYNTIKTAAEPHGVGYVWASMLWDLYWNLVDKYGFNPNPYESWNTGGNNLALQLVVDGMKFAPCEPGFEDARDAIIAADAALTGDPANGVSGDNECLIWRTFARRGLGINADQGDFESKTDGVEGFAVPAHCSGG
jgi:uncharacterized membrane protein YkoI